MNVGDVVDKVFKLVWSLMTAILIFCIVAAGLILFWAVLNAF